MLHKNVPHLRKLLYLCNELKKKDMCTVTAREFRQNMKNFMDLALDGEDVMICRGTEYFLLSPVQIQPEITPELQRRIDNARAEIERGECTTIRNKEDLDAYFENL